MDPYDYHLSRNGMGCFTKLLVCKRINSIWLSMECGDMEEIIEEDFEEDVEENDNIHDLEYTNGSNEVVKTFNQKCVICLQQDTENKNKQCGRQCICEECCQLKGDIDIFKCVIRRT